MHRLADLPPDAELACTHCGEVNLAVGLAEPETVPSRGPECDDCRRRAKVHRAPAPDTRIADAMANGGLRPDVNVLFGPGWLEDS